MWRLLRSPGLLPAAVPEDAQVLVTWTKASLNTGAQEFHELSPLRGLSEPLRQQDRCGTQAAVGLAVLLTVTSVTAEPSPRQRPGNTLWEPCPQAGWWSPSLAPRPAHCANVSKPSSAGATPDRQGLRGRETQRESRAPLWPLGLISWAPAPCLRIWEEPHFHLLCRGSLRE